MEFINALKLFLFTVGSLAKNHRNAKYQHPNIALSDIQLTDIEIMKSSRIHLNLYEICGLM